MQYATDPNVTATYNQQPVVTSTGSYFNLPYGTTTFPESDNVNHSSGIPQNLSNTGAMQPIISDNKNSSTYMQSNSQMNTTTTQSAETSKSEHMQRISSAQMLILLTNSRR